MYHLVILHAGSFCASLIVNSLFQIAWTTANIQFSGVGFITRLLFYRNQAVYPLVVAAHPMEANQFAIGLSDGSVKVMEPTESEGKWGVSPPVDNGVLNDKTTSSSTTSNHTPDQLQR